MALAKKLLYSKLLMYLFPRPLILGSLILIIIVMVFTHARYTKNVLVNSSLMSPLSRMRSSSDGFSTMKLEILATGKDVGDNLHGILEQVSYNHKLLHSKSFFTCFLTLLQINRLSLVINTTTTVILTPTCDNTVDIAL